MLNKAKNLTPFIISFIMIEGVLGYFIQVTTGTICSSLSISSIILAFLFCSLLLRREFYHIITVFALFFTVCADFLLCGLVDFTFIRELAMCFFVGTQTCYFIRLFINQTKKERLIHIIVRLCFSAFAVILTALVLKENTNFLSLISLFYYANLIVNIVFAFIQVKVSPIFAIGLLLFAFCDIFVGLSLIGDFINISTNSIINKINALPLNMAWLFYVPSQTLLALSTIKK